VKQKHGLQTVFPRPDVLLRQVTTWPDKKSMFVAVAVPLRHIEDSLAMTAYRLQPEATTIEAASNLEIVWESEHSHIAVDKDR